VADIKCELPFNTNTSFKSARRFRNRPNLPNISSNSLGKNESSIVSSITCLGRHGYDVHKEDLTGPYEKSLVVW
jgi:hypothetical protein